MRYHTAHHVFPSVPFWKLSQLNAKIEAQAGAVHRMGWIGFQIQVIKRLGQKDESQWPQNEVWVVPTSGGRVRVAAE
jgi:fatty acid desaturase